MSNKKRSSRHYSRDRRSREAVIQSIGEGKIEYCFVVDNGHKKGLEIHSITDNAIIIVTNAKTGLLVTKMIARPGQIRRYFEGAEKFESWQVSGKHEGWNMWIAI